MYRHYQIMLLLVPIAGCEKDLPAEKENEGPKKDLYPKIEGESEPIPDELVSKGDSIDRLFGCADCHRIDTKAKGPAFKEYRSEVSSPNLPMWTCWPRKGHLRRLRIMGKSVMSPHHTI